MRYDAASDPELGFQIFETNTCSHQPYLFSVLSFAGGIGGAALTLLSSCLADIHGAAAVLRGCALVEIALGLFAFFLVPLVKTPLAPREAFHADPSRRQPR